MKIYVAGSFINKPMIAVVENMLRTDGHIITSNWLKHKGTADKEELMREAIIDLQGVCDCEVLVLVWPARYSSSTEMGAALGQSKPVYIYGRVEETVRIEDAHPANNLFYNHPAVHQFGNLKELRQALRIVEHQKLLAQHDALHAAEWGIYL